MTSCNVHMPLAVPVVAQLCPVDEAFPCTTDTFSPPWKVRVLQLYCRVNVKTQKVDSASGGGQLQSPGSGFPGYAPVATQSPWASQDPPDVVDVYVQ